MVDDLGLDLEAIKAASGGHSIYAPSGSVIWLNSPGCLIPNLLAPDSAGEDAAYGTVGHEIGEQWLKAIPTIMYGAGALAQAQIDEAEPSHRLGEIVIVEEKEDRFEIKIDQEMLDYVRQYVEWIMPLPGDHYIETRVDHSDLTPIPGQGGTSDHAACQPGVLTISDLKMGMIRVFAERNPQLMIYAYGFFRRWDWAYNFQRIVIRIAQPRLGHFDTWECSREELLEFAEYVRERAHEGWVIDGPRKPGWWCRKGFCNAISTCAAHLCWLADMSEQEADEVFDEFPTDDYGMCQICEGLGCDVCSPQPPTINSDGSIEGVYTVKDMTARAEQLVSGKLDLTPKLLPAQMNTEALAKLLPMRGVVEKFFNEVHRELLHRAVDGDEVPGFYLGQGRAGDRKWIDVEDAKQSLAAMIAETDTDPTELYPPTLLSPPQAQKIIRKALGCTVKEAEAMLDSLVARKAGQHTLVPVGDDRARLMPPADDVFEDHSDMGGL